MDAKWHIAFCNVTITEYAEMSYRDYYACPANTQELLELSPPASTIRSP